VKLDGAAGFEVAEGGKTEFRVYAGDAVVVAHGTAFSVHAYPEDSATTVVVTEGNVEVREGKLTRPLEAGSALFMAHGQAPRQASADEREAADGWRTGTLRVANRTLRDVLPQLKRWYNLDLTVPDKALLDRRVTLRASLDSSGQAIRGVEKSAGVTFGYHGQTMVFEDGKAATSTDKSKN
jgi:transmembrane sensor